MSDLRVTLRQLRQSPAHIAACILSLAAGMAVCVAVFSAINAMVFSPIPGVGERARLVRVWWSNGGERSSTDEFGAIETSATAVFSNVAAESVRVLAVSLPSGPASKPVAFASARYFETLQTRAVAGRLLDVRDAAPGSAPAAVIGESLWREAFGADASALGRVLQVGGRPFTLVGVVPAGLPGLLQRDVGQRAADYPQVWLPLSHALTWMRVPPGTPWLAVQGRLRSGVSDRTAQSSVAVISGRLLQQSAARPRDARLLVFRAGLDWGADALQSLLVLAVYLFLPMSVLAIGCANVVNLQLARATERARELTVRMALGASRARLARLLGLEVVLLASIAGLAGWRGASVLLQAMQPWFPAPMSIDRHVLAYTFALVAGAIAAGGFAPGWLAARDVVAAGLKEQVAGGTRQRGVRGFLVVFQVATCVALLFVSGLIIHSIQANAVVMPSDALGALVADVDLMSVRPGRPDTRTFVDRVEESLMSAAAVRSSAFADFFGPAGAVRYGWRADETPLRRFANGGFVTRGWFEAMGVRLLAGRLFERGDTPATAAVVTEAFASASGETAGSILGRQVRVAHPENARARQVEIVGVVSNAVVLADGHSFPMILLPMPDSPPAALALLVRAADLDTAMRAAAAAVGKADADVPLTRAQSVSARLDERFRTVRASTRFAVELGLLALVLATVGLYAVLAYAVRQRTREIGIRLAVGATIPQVVTLVLRQGLLLALLGIVIGSVVAVTLALLLRSVLAGLSPIDPRTLMSTGALLLGAALAASALPAWRAASVDPAVALREE